MPEASKLDAGRWERLQELLSRPCYHQWLGVELIKAEPGQVTLRLPFKREFLADENDSYVHGGVISSLADIAGDFALMTELGRGLPTVDLRVDYLRPATAGTDLEAWGRTVRSGGRLGVADVEVRAVGGKTVAVARAVYYTAAT